MKTTWQHSETIDFQVTNHKHRLLTVLALIIATSLLLISLRVLALVS